MFSRIFNIRKEPSKDNFEKRRSYHLDSFQAAPRLPKLEKDSIRVLIFRDCERRAGKTLLFDSDAIVSVKEPCIRQNEKDKQGKLLQNRTQKKATDHGCDSSQKYQCRKPSGDVKMLGEMIFGSVAMVYKGSVLKVHLMRTPPQLMMTKVFALRSRSAGVNFCDSELSLTSCGSSLCTPQINISPDSISLDSRTGSPVDHMIRSYSNPIGMERSSMSLSTTSLYSTNAFKRSTWSISSTDDLPRSSSVISAGSSLHSPCGSYQRRFIRSQQTSLDSSRLWKTKPEQSEEMRTAFKQQPKIGIGIIFKLWDNPEDNKLFQDFFFTHYTLFEAHLQIVRVKIEKSFYLRQRFIDAAINAVESFQDDVFCLCYSPRIIEPVWLNLMVVTEQAYHEAVVNYIKSFMNLVQICETKENNYFLSILLTAVLTHHSSWVATVMSSGSVAKRAYLDKHSSKALDVLAKCHPYNPLWAQLCDLYGCTGTPLKISRTVVVGKNSSLVTELLHALTYFIRCSDIKENDVRVPKTRNSLYRSSGCGWSDSYSSGTPISTPSSGHVTDVTKDNAPKYCHSDSQRKSQILIKDINLDKCYCSVVKQLDNTAKIKLFYSISASNFDSKSCLNENLVACSTCVVCGAVESPILSKYCHKCCGMNNLCHHCIYKTKCKFPNVVGKEKDQKEAVATALSNTLKESCLLETCLPKTSSFKCYCCTPGSRLIANKTSSDDEMTPRQRNMSDPMDCIITSNFKSNLLRNSTTSRDSGAEMACSIASSPRGLEESAENLSRSNSFSSHGNQDNGIAPDFDSDYCSVDNEQLATTLIDSNLESFHRKNDCTLPEEFLKISHVSKSCSSTTLKGQNTPLSSSFERNDSLLITEEDECQFSLETDLQNMNLEELPILGSTSRPSRKQSRCSRNAFEPIAFGHSLFAGYNSSYLPNFVLQGTSNLDCKRLATDLQNTVKHSVLDEHVSDAVCIVADTDNWTCELWTLSKRTDSFNGNTSETLLTKPVFASGLVSSMIESAKDLWDINMPPHFCLLHLEEQLKDIYNRSKVLDEYCSTNDELNKSAFMESFGYHANDIELLTSISSSHRNFVNENSLL